MTITTTETHTFQVGDIVRRPGDSETLVVVPQTGTLFTGNDWVHANETGHGEPTGIFRADEVELVNPRTPGKLAVGDVVYTTEVATGTIGAPALTIATVTMTHREDGSELAWPHVKTETGSTYTVDAETEVVRVDLTTLEGLRALPVGSVVRDCDDDNWIKDGEDENGPWQGSTSAVVLKYTPLTLLRIDELKVDGVNEMPVIVDEIAEAPALAVGDKVTLTGVYYSHRAHLIGKVGTISRLDVPGYPSVVAVVQDVAGFTVYATAVEPVVEVPTCEGFKVGDRVVLNDKAPAETVHNQAGVVTELPDVTHGHPYVMVMLDRGTPYPTKPEEMAHEAEPLAEWELELLNAQAPVAEEPTFAYAVGDKVLVKTDIFQTSVPEGSVGLVEKIETPSRRVVFLVNEYPFYEEELELFVEKPVATFGDYAVGDTVKVVDESFDDWAQEGITGTVTKVDNYVRVHLSIHKDPRPAFPFLPTEIEKVDPMPAMLEKVDEVVKALSVSSIYWAPIGTPVEDFTPEPIEGEVVTEPSLREQLDALEDGSVVVCDGFYGKQEARIKVDGHWRRPNGTTITNGSTYDINTGNQADAGTLSILFAA